MTTEYYPFLTKFVERYTNRTECWRRAADLRASGHTVTLEWEAARRGWRLVYWKEPQKGDPDEAHHPASPID